jgi:oxalate decarboxylase
MRFLLLLSSVVASSTIASASPLVHARVSSEYVYEVPKDFKGSKPLRSVVEKRQSIQGGEPYDPSTRRGSIFSGGTNQELDLQNPVNLGGESTDNGVVVNLKWSFSDSKTRLMKGGWSREQG